ncbi:MAG TPA: uridine diphosphate-N-acetylglucosamine-binding protein YvcK [Terriglobia bacterium]|nr:uridine diphosphate-N-acetylglucosamine-binding protein YvcK [Terriglobia bacterium]
MKSPSIVSIGGGSGLSTLLRGLKNGPGRLSVIVTVTDDGGSSGRIRDELGAIPPGDIRNCMIALSEDENLMARLFRVRFNSKGARGELDGHSSKAARGELDGHSFGNLFLAAMADVTGDFAEAVRLTSEVLAIKGIIYPSTNSLVTLRAKMRGGEWIDGETSITGARGRIERIELNPRHAEPLPGALEAIARADIVTLGPGSLYTSLIPNLVVEKIIDAIEHSPAKRIYIQNIMTQPGETEGYTAADHVQALMDHCCGRLLFSQALVNSVAPSARLLDRYRADGADAVELDRPRLKALGVETVECDLLAEDGVIRHDPDRLAEAVYRMGGF